MSRRNNSQITYATLLAQQQCIRVPMLQRDYAQGRSDQSDVREQFLAALEGALKRPAGDPELPLNLDFIYGSLEGSKETTRFSPLDGQQRLTTLFLLHWFLAWQDQAWAEFGGMFRDENKRSRFTYKVRQSSTEFFDKLVVFEPGTLPEETPSLKSLITDQPWYFRHWRLDPTVQSVLTMLDAIHRRFRGSSGLFARLTDTQRPAITFQLLLLENFGLSDDLYIKMNARGKPLTAFESFKAQYEHTLGAQFVDKSRRLGERDYPVAKFVALRMDTAWADLFWPHRDRVTNLCDDVMMHVFRIVALVTFDPASKAYTEDVSLLRGAANGASYSAFHSRGWLCEEFTETLIALMEAWATRSAGSDAFRPLLPDTSYFDEPGIFEKIRRDSASLTFTEVTQFAAYALFIRHHPGAVTSPSFQEWMRVVRNLAVNTPIERADQLKSAAQGLRELLAHATRILEHLATQPSSNRIQGFYQPQVEEEQTKAGLLLNHAGWKPLLERAEQHGYFVGQVDFLCEFSEANAARASAPDCRWDDNAHRGLQTRFTYYLERAEAMFSPTGLRDDEHHRWRRALLVVGDYLLPTGSNQSLLVDAATEPTSWKRLLRTSSFKDSYEGERRRLLQSLWDRLNGAAPVSAQLDEIIAKTSGLPAWREALVKTPTAISYCGRKLVRKRSDTDVLLLSKSTLGGAHIQLFILRLHEDLNATGMAKQLGALGTPTLDHPYDSQLHHLNFSIWIKKSYLRFTVEFDAELFGIRVASSALKDLPELRTLLTDSTGFEPVGDDGYWLMTSYPPAAVIAELTKLGQLLATLTTK